MSELTVETLREIAPEDLAAMLPAVVQMGDQAGVILRLANAATGLVELYQAGQVSHMTTTALGADFVTDHAVQAEQLHAALKLVHDTALQKLATQLESHEQTLAAIRQYAIDRHEAGDICREGLDRFLEEFEFEPYTTVVRVEYTISGSYEIEGRDAEFAEEDARGYLRPDLSSLDDVVDESSSYEVTFLDVSEL